MTVVTPRRLALFPAAAALVFTLWRWGPTLWEWHPDGQDFWVLVGWAALWYAWLTYLLPRAGYRPALVVEHQLGATTVRNIGERAALHVTITDNRGRQLATVTDVAPRSRATVSRHVSWDLHESRYLFYQDVFGRWHATKWVGRMLGPADPIPNRIIGRVLYVPLIPAFEHMQQLGRPGDPRNIVRRYWARIRKRRAENDIMSAIREAVRYVRLKEPFTVTDVARITGIEGVMDRFLPNHKRGNPENEREFFDEDSGAYTLIR